MTPGHVFWCKNIVTSAVLYFQALKMSYFSNKPYPTPNHLLPQLKNNKKEVMDQCKPSLKRKIEGDSGMSVLVHSLR